MTAGNYGPEDLGSRLQRTAARLLKTAMIRAKNTRPIVSFTFDDAPRSSMAHGAAILEKNGVRGTYYIASALCGTTSDQYEHLDASECVDLHRRGHEIGGHTHTHQNLRQISTRMLRQEIEANREFFHKLGQSIELTNFAYPYNSPTIAGKLILQNSFETCRGGVPGINSGFIDRSFLRAVSLEAGSSLPEFKEWIDKCHRQNGWLVLFTHDVSETPTPFGVTPSLVASLVDYALTKGCEVATVREAVARLRGPVKYTSINLGAALAGINIGAGL